MTEFHQPHPSPWDRIKAMSAEMEDVYEDDDQLADALIDALLSYRSHRNRLLHCISQIQVPTPYLEAILLDQHGTRNLVDLTDPQLQKLLYTLKNRARSLQNP